MYIKSLYIGSFGKLREKTVDFQNGLNLIYGENESGKSTLSVFIKFMLYGFSSGKKKSIDTNDKAHYLPWNGSGVYGTMTVVHDGREYNIERSACTGKDKCTVTEISSGQTVQTPDGVGEYFLGLPEEAFARSAHVLQASGCESGGAELSKQIQSMLFSDEDDIGVQKAEKALSAARTELLHLNGKGGKLFELENTADVLKEEYDKAVSDNAEFIKCSGEYEDRKRAYTACEKQITKLEKELSDCDEYTKAMDTLVRLSNFRKNVEALRTKAEALRNELPDGFDENTGELLSIAFEGYKNADEAYKETKKKYEEKQSELKRLEDSATVAEKELCDDIELLEKTEKSKGALTAVSAASAAISLLLAILALVFAHPALWVGFGALAAVCAVFATMLFAGKGRLRELSEKYNCELGKTSSEIQGRLSVYAYMSELRHRVEGEKRIAEEASIKLGERLFELNKMLDKEARSIEDANESIGALKKKIAAYASAKADYDAEVAATERFESTIDIQSLKNTVETVEAPTRERTAIDLDLRLHKGKADTLRGMIGESEREIAVLKATAKLPLDAHDALKNVLDEIEAEKKRLEAIDLARQVLSEAGNELKTSIAPKIAEHASKLIAKLSDGRYGELVIDEDFSVSVLDNGAPRSVEYLSAGTKDMVYLAFRYGLLRLLFDGGSPIMIFDDAFARMDDKRLSTMMAAVKELSAETQIIILSCHVREAKLLSDGSMNIIKF